MRLLGLANRAHKVTLGMSATAKSIRQGKCRLLLLAADLAENARQKIAVDAQKAAVPVVEFGTKELLGQVVGRGELGIVGIEDAGFALALRDSLPS